MSDVGESPCDPVHVNGLAWHTGKQTAKTHLARSATKSRMTANIQVSCPVPLPAALLRLRFLPLLPELVGCSNCISAEVPDGLGQLIKMRGSGMPMWPCRWGAARRRWRGVRAAGAAG